MAEILATGELPDLSSEQVEAISSAAKKGGDQRFFMQHSL